MRSSVFISLSVLVHVICVTALAIGHYRKTQEEKFKIESVEMVAENAELSAPIASVTDDEVVALPKKAAAVAAKPKASKKILTAQPIANRSKEKTAQEITELPAKQVVPEQLDPQIDDSQTVAVASVSIPQDPTPELVPVKEVPPVGVEADQDDGLAKTDNADTEEKPSENETEAASPEATEAVDKADKALSDQATLNTPSNNHPPVDVQMIPKHVSETSGEGSAVKAGATKGAAVSYLTLKQMSGNKAPSYPMSARLQKRQGEVGLLYRVTNSGAVADVQITKSSGHADLDQAAVQAIAKFKFVPGQEGWARHPVQFALKGSSESMPSKLRSANAE